MNPRPRMSAHAIERLLIAIAVAILLGAAFVAISAAVSPASATTTDECLYRYVKTDDSGNPWPSLEDPVIAWLPDGGPIFPHTVGGFYWTREGFPFDVSDQDWWMPYATGDCTPPTTVPETTTTAPETTTTSSDPCELATVDPECGPQPDQTPTTLPPTLPADPCSVWPETCIPAEITPEPLVIEPVVEGVVLERTLPNTGGIGNVPWWLLAASAVAVPVGVGMAFVAADNRKRGQA